MMDMRSLVDVFDHFANIYKKNSKRIERDFDLCERFAKISRYFVIGMPIFYLSNAALFNLAIYCANLMGTEDRLRPPIAYFPILDRSIIGLIITHILNNFEIEICVITFLPYEMAIYLVIANIMLNSEVIARDLDDLKVVLQNPKTTPLEKKTRLSEIVRSQRALNE